MSTESNQPKQGIGTLSVHGGQSPDPTTKSRAVPIYQTTSYCSTTPTTPPACSACRSSATSTRAS